MYMSELQQLIKPVWKVEKWLNSAWSLLTQEEQLAVSGRVNELFHCPIPFQLKHEKSLYMHLFSLLAQLEIFGLQGLIKSLEKMPHGDLQHTFRQQIVDEIFHAIVFTKLTFECSAPFALPPTHSKRIERFLSHLINDHNLKVSLVLVNLVAEGWIEEIFLALQEHKVAPCIFDVVLADETQHVENSALFLEIGLPECDLLLSKLAAFEEELIALVFSEHIYAPTLVNFIGVAGAKKLFDSIDKKHRLLLSKINLAPSTNWCFLMENVPFIIDDFFHDQSQGVEITQTSTRKMFTSIWQKPNHPTQSSVFSIDVTPIEFFEKKYPTETLTCLMLQTLSKAMANHPPLKNYMAHNKIYNPHDSYVGLGVLLPGSNDHLGMIDFKNCHNLTITELAAHIKADIEKMLYCYQRTHELKIEHPYLNDLFNDMFIPRSENLFRDPFTDRPSISLSNVGQWGYEVPVSPLFPNETVKLTLAKVDKKQIWNNQSKSFEVKDILPVGISVDHRVFDGNIPIPHMMQKAFDEQYHAMLHTKPAILSSHSTVNLDKFIALIEKRIKVDLEFTFRSLFYASHLWKNYTGIQSLIRRTNSLHDSKARIKVSME